MSEERTLMDHKFSVFNLHVNKAGDRAKTAFIARYGQKKWDKEIEPFHHAGIMSIFGQKPNEYTEWYVNAIWLFVNDF